MILFLHQECVLSSNRVESLLLGLKVWTVKRKLKLNDSKTKITVIRGNSKQVINNDLLNLDVGSVQLLFVELVMILVLI